MKFSKVTAIVRTDTLEAVENALKALEVPGITVTRVKGFGEYANFFTPDWMCSHARLEVFVRRDRAGGIADAIRHSACTECAGDGIVAVLPVEHVYRIRDGCELS